MLCFRKKAVSSHLEIFTEIRLSYEIKFEGQIQADTRRIFIQEILNVICYSGVFYRISISGF